MSRVKLPAYPYVFENTGDLNVSAPDGEVVAPGCQHRLSGLTIREHFTAMVMQGLCANSALCTQEEHWVDLPKLAVAIADSLILELAKEPK